MYRSKICKLSIHIGKHHSDGENNKILGIPQNIANDIAEWYDELHEDLVLRELNSVVEQVL